MIRVSEAGMPNTVISRWDSAYEEHRANAVTLRVDQAGLDQQIPGCILSLRGSNVYGELVVFCSLRAEMESYDVNIPYPWLGRRRDGQAAFAGGGSH